MSALIVKKNSGTYNREEWVAPILSQRFVNQVGLGEERRKYIHRVARA